MKRSRKQPIRAGDKEADMVRAIDKLALYEDFCRTILPALHPKLTDGSSAEDLYKMFEAHAAARNITIAMTEVDPGKAMTAIKDILDRTQGKAKERTEHLHRYENLKDEELDSLVASRLADLEDDDDRDPQVQ